MHTAGPKLQRRILVIDDNTAIHDDIRKILCEPASQGEELESTKALLFGEVVRESSKIMFEIDGALQGEEGLAMVQAAGSAGRPYSLAFVDVRMPPGWDGIETIVRIWEHDPDIQFVVCTAYSDYSWEDIIQKIGQSPNMVVLKKPFDNIEVLQLAHALTDKWSLNKQVQTRLQDLDQLVEDRTAELRTVNEQLKADVEERILMQEALRVSEERFSKAFEVNPTPLSIHSMRNGTTLDANMGFQALAGRNPLELIGRTPSEIGLWPDAERFLDTLAMLQDHQPVRDAACRLRTGAGAIRDILFSAEAIELQGEDCFIATWRDITEQLILEQQLRHSQKMDAVGQLSAGIAHDFNNLLTVIQGNASLAIADGHGPPDPDLLESILAATQSAAKLVSQLLTFSNKQLMEASSVDLKELLKPISEMLPRVIGEDIILKFEVSPSLPRIRVDTVMIEQMLLNLSVNARDAMPRGGRMTIKAEAVEVTAQAARLNHEARAGCFLCLSVSDTGTGIPPDVLPHIFEPFFTTKPVGKGSGLGLATTYGIAKQHGGWLSVESELGKGTTFRCFLPFETTAPMAPAALRASNLGNAAQGSGADSPSPSSGTPKYRGSETVLVVEDEDNVRRYVTKTLAFHGYHVIGARDGVEALRIWDELGPRVDVLLTDVVMPQGISGIELARRLSLLKPALKVILTSGYNRELEAGTAPGSGPHRFIAKPYEFEALLKAVRSSLDDGSG